MSKGSGRRPAAVPEAQVVDNWTRTFAPKPTAPYVVHDVVHTDNAAVCENLRKLQQQGGSFGVLGGAAAGSPLHLMSVLKCPDLDLCRRCGSDVSVCGEKLCQTNIEDLL